MTEVTVQIIPLYQYSITMKTPKEEYDHVIIADSIDKIIEGIAHYETTRGESVEKNDKYFRIDDYIVLPREESDQGHYNNKKFRLYCLSDDLIYGGYGEGDVYEVFIKGDMPEAVPDIQAYQLDCEHIMQEIYHGRYVADALYTYSKTHMAREEVVKEYNMEEGKSLAEATIFLAELITKEKTV